MANSPDSAGLASLIETIDVARARIDSCVYGDHDIMAPQLEHLHTSLGRLSLSAFGLSDRTGARVAQVASRKR